MSSPAWVSLPSWAVFYLCSLPRTEADSTSSSAKPEAKSEQKNNNNAKQNNTPKQAAEKSSANQDPDAQARDAFLARVEEIKKMGAQPVRNQIFGALHSHAHPAAGIQVKVNSTRHADYDPHFFYWDFVNTTKRDEYYKQIGLESSSLLRSDAHSTNPDPHFYYWEFLKTANEAGGRGRKGSWTAANKQPSRERRGSVGLRGDARSTVQAKQ